MVLLLPQQTPMSLLAILFQLQTLLQASLILMAEYIIPVIALMVTGITSVPHLQVLSVHKQNKMLPTIFVLKVGDSQPIVNKVALLDTPPLSPLYIAGSTTMARSTLLAPTVTGGLLLRTIATISAP